ncbi:hypothetical protein [Lysobacter gummosus]|uniref:hypothetical protein n=1 Tax=Lysobacter gummosus TaxID=262324 RepID=UPI0036281E58
MGVTVYSILVWLAGVVPAWGDGTTRRSYLPSFPRRRALLYFGGAEHPVTSGVLARKALDSRLRGNDGLEGTRLTCTKDAGFPPSRE